MSKYNKKSQEYLRKRWNYPYKDMWNKTEEEIEEVNKIYAEQEKWDKKYNKVKWKREQELDDYKELINKEIVKNHENNTNPEYAKELLQEIVDVNKNDDYEKERFSEADVVSLLSSGYGKENIKPIIDEFDTQKKQLDEEFDSIIPTDEEIKNSKINDKLNLINHYYSSGSDNIMDVVGSANYNNDKDLDIIDVLKINNKNNKNYFEEYNDLSNEMKQKLVEVGNDLGFDEDDSEYIADYIHNFHGTGKYGFDRGVNTTDTSEKSREIKRKYSKDTDKEITEEDYDKINKAIEETENIFDKIDKLSNSGRYIFIDGRSFKEAIDNLGYENKNAHELKDTQWNKIYKEYAKIEKRKEIENEKKSKIFEKKHDIFTNLERKYGEMVYHFNNWDFVNEAKKNLGYDKIEDGKLTPAQWKNIKKEIIENTGEAKYQQYLKDMKNMFN